MTMLLEIELPPISMLWEIHLGIGTIGLALSAFRWWLGVPTFGLLLLFSFAWLFQTYFETADIFDAINRQEPYFVLNQNLAIAAGFLLQIIGVAIYAKRRRKVT